MNVQFKDEPNESYTYRVSKDAKTNKVTVHQDSNEPWYGREASRA